VGKADPEQYRMAVQQVENLLDGKMEALYESLEQQMRSAAQNQDFERAAEIRDQIRALKSFFGTAQQAYDPDLGDLDFLGFARAGDYALIQHYQVRGGQILGRISRFVEGVKEASDAELLEAFLRDYYLEATPLPPLVLLPFELEAQEAFSAFLSSKGRKVEVRIPQRGDKTRLIELAQHNAQTALQTELKLLERKGDHPGLKGLMEVLGLSRRPYRIEGYDISNLLGESVVGSITVFEGGRPKKAEYRRIKIRGLQQPDDFFSMEQTILRRFTGSLAQQMPIPDLILVDGGLGQVRAAQKALKQAGLEIPLVGLAKRAETLVLPDGQTIALPQSHPALQLLIYQRDETHRNGLETSPPWRNSRP
jgi:excinuclease ABC subunit C